MYFGAEDQSAPQCVLRVSWNRGQVFRFVGMELPDPVQVHQARGIILACEDI